MSTQETYIKIGTPILASESKKFDSNKFAPEWKHEARDERGRRRFHGAFTGGFSAGYFNTAGSKEGWEPQEYVSSRGNRASTENRQDITQFMDDEDLQNVLISLNQPDDINVEVKDFISQLPNGISGFSSVVSDLFIEPKKESLGIISKLILVLGTKILKVLGWKPGHGIGPPKVDISLLTTYGVDVKNTDIKKYLKPPKDVELLMYNTDIEKKNLGLGKKPTDLETTINEEFKVLSNQYSRPVEIKSSRIEIDFSIPTESVKNIASDYDQIIDIPDRYKRSNDFLADDDRIILKRKPRRPPPIELSSNTDTKKNFIPGSSIDGFVVAIEKDIVDLIEYKPPIIPDGFDFIHKFTKEQDMSRKIYLRKNRDNRNKNRAELLESYLFDKEDQRKHNFIESQSKLDKENESHGNTAEDRKLLGSFIKEALPIDVYRSAMKSEFRPFSTDKTKSNRYNEFLIFSSSYKPLGESLYLLPNWPKNWNNKRVMDEIKEFVDTSKRFKPMGEVLAKRFVNAKRPDLDPTKKIEIMEWPSAGLQTTKPDPLPAKEEITRLEVVNRKILAFYPHRLLCKRFGCEVPDPKSYMSLITQPDNIPLINKNKNNYQSSSKLGSKLPMQDEDLDLLIPKDVTVKQLDMVVDSAFVDPAMKPDINLFKAVFDSSSSDED